MKDLTASSPACRMTRGSQFFADTPPPAADSEHVKRLRARGPRDLRPHQHLRAGPQPHLRAAAARADAEPVGSHAHLRRLERRRGGRGRRAHAADGARHRRLRVDPRARRLLRAGRPQADAGPQHDGALRGRGAGRLLGRARGHAHRARLRRPAGRHRRARPRRSLRRRRPPARPFLQEVGAAPGRLRIAFTATAPNGAPVEAEPPARAARDGAALRRSRPPGRGGRSRRSTAPPWCRPSSPWPPPTPW